MGERFGEAFGIAFVIGYIISFVVVIVIFMSYGVPRGHVVKKRNKVVMQTPMMTSLTERRERKIKEAVQQISELEKSITRFSFKLLNDATNGFCQGNVIGIGKMGAIYKGMLPCGCLIAVKKLKLKEFQYLEKEFISKLVILSRLKHNNIVPFLGFCIESKESLLMCYNYMANGKLYDWLHPVRGGSSFLEWRMRVFIVMKIAKGLTYLHNNSEFPTAHLNLSSNTILLDKNFEPKISNFGGAVFISKDSRKSFENVFKKDVYRFGILLLELITGEDPVRNSESFRSLKETLAELIAKSTTGSYSSLCYVVDKSVIGQGLDPQILHFLRVACDCLQTLPDQRPTIIQVYKKLMAFNITALQKSDNID